MIEPRWVSQPGTASRVRSSRFALTSTPQSALAPVASRMWARVFPAPHPMSTIDAAAPPLAEMNSAG